MKDYSPATFSARLNALPRDALFLCFRKSSNKGSPPYAVYVAPNF